MALIPMEYEGGVQTGTLSTSGITQTNYTISSPTYSIKDGVMIITATILTNTTQTGYKAVANLPDCPNGNVWQSQYMYYPEDGGATIEIGVNTSNQLVARKGTNGKYARFQLITV